MTLYFSFAARMARICARRGHELRILTPQRPEVNGTDLSRCCIRCWRVNERIPANGGTET